MSFQHWFRFAAAVVLAAAGCGRKAPCDRCETVVVAATSEPVTLVPPLVSETVGRDIGDQIYERLADLEAGGATIDPHAYRPALAAHWEALDSLTWRFFLRPGAQWSDGQPVTAEDVRFSFDAYQDSVLDSPARGNVLGITVSVEDSGQVLIHFDRSYAEQLYDATWHVRIIPEHIWRKIPRDQWAGDTSLAHLVGSGPYRVNLWVRGQSLTLQARAEAAPRANITRAVWRFADDPDAALNLVLSHEADLLEAVGSPDRVARVEADSTLGLVRYPSAAYGFLGYRLSAIGNQPSTVRYRPDLLSDRRVRRALAMAIDRPAVARAILGPATKAPPGPISQLLWIWDDGITTLPFDTVGAQQLLEAAGWHPGKTSSGIRTKAGKALAFDILVPSTSPARGAFAEALQQAWRVVGADVSITAVDFPVFQQRLAEGRFDSYIGAWLDEPSPRGLADQWTRRGFGVLNYGGYDDRVFDSLFARAINARELPMARAAWREALDTLNADAPALFLYAPTNAAAVSRRVQRVTIDPYSWLSGLREWTLSDEKRERR